MNKPPKTDIDNMFNSCNRKFDEQFTSNFNSLLLTMGKLLYDLTSNIPLRLRKNSNTVDANCVSNCLSPPLEVMKENKLDNTCEGKYEVRIMREQTRRQTDSKI